MEIDQERVQIFWLIIDKQFDESMGFFFFFFWLAVSLINLSLSQIFKVDVMYSLFFNGRFLFQYKKK